MPPAARTLCRRFQAVGVWNQVIQRSEAGPNAKRINRPHLTRWFHIWELGV